MAPAEFAIQSYGPDANKLCLTFLPRQILNKVFNQIHTVVNQMSDMISDINLLLSHGLGDRRVLEQILRAVQHNEAVSVYEKNYVAKLVAELGSEPRSPGIPPADSAGDRGTSGTAGVAGTVGPAHGDKTQKSNIIKIAAGGGAALVVLLVVGLSLSGTAPDDPGVSDDIAIPASGIALRVDDDSYRAGEIISIYGRTHPSLTGSIVLSIEDADENLVWREDVPLKSDGTFSTLVIAGSPGWDKGDTHTLTARHGTMSDNLTFLFVS